MTNANKYFFITFTFKSGNRNQVAGAGGLGIAIFQTVPDICLDVVRTDRHPALGINLWPGSKIINRLHGKGKDRKNRFCLLPSRNGKISGITQFVREGDGAGTNGVAPGRTMGELMRGAMRLTKTDGCAGHVCKSCLGK
jgi:hypothetical protein